MRDLLSKLISLELGLWSTTKDKIQGFVEEMIRVGEVSQEEGKKLVDEYIARGNKSRQELRNEIDKMILESVNRQDLITRSEFEQLKLEVRELRQTVRREEVEHAFVEKKGV
jgi:polyhydroxyalkanoate synthesis regulator phasin